VITCRLLQGINGWAVAMLLARHATADVQRMWLEKWPPAHGSGSTMAGLSAHCWLTMLVQMWPASMWKQKWLAALSRRHDVTEPQ